MMYAVPSTNVIGFIGLGVMGGAIAKRLLAMGPQLVVYDTNREVLEDFREMGAVVALSPKGVADRAEIVLACLPGPDICRDVALAPDGVFAGRRIRYYIETSTMGGATSIALSDELRKHGIAMLDAPISGGPAAAETGALTAMIAGGKDALEACRPVIRLFAETVFHVGDMAGQGQLSKLINNAICINACMATIEAFVVADEAGLDRHALTALLNSSSGATFASRVIIPYSLLADDPKPFGRMAILLKDLQLYMKEVGKLGLKLPIASSLSQFCEKAGSDPDRETIDIVYEFLARSAGAARTAINA